MALRFEDIDVEELSPMMQQYVSEKKKRPDCILFFRLGDFYELFFDDAVLVSKELELTLTSRDCGLSERAPMAGVPHHSVESYLSKMIEKGYKIAICEQMEDPAQAKGIVRREVVRVLTPGTVTESSSVEEKKNHYIASVFQLDKAYGLVALDLSTGDFYGTQLLTGFSEVHCYDELHRFRPAEIIANSVFMNSNLANILKEEQFFFTQIEDAFFNAKEYTEYIEESPLNQDFIKAASSALLYYILDTQKQIPSHVKKLETYEISQYMKLGATARKNLELTETLRDRKKRGSLLWVLDQCKTAMGSRMLRRWLEQPLLHPMEIQHRQDAVEALLNRFILRQELREVLGGMNDIQRLLSKLSMNNMNARELRSLVSALEKIPALQNLLLASDDHKLQTIAKQMDALDDFVQTIVSALADDLPITIQDGGLIREGYDALVDKYKLIHEKGSSWILELEQRERENTGIKNLKVGYNRVFGYYVEVTKSNLNAVPDHYIRRQTLTNAERYILPELKEMEDEILGAERKLLEREYEVFIELRQKAKEKETIIAKNADVVATLDCWLSLAEVADRNHYVKPEIVLEPVLHIEEGRHPVVEKMLTKTEFVANDAFLNQDERRFILLTGPNMSGKSTFMRQIAQITILAQMGSFVPAKAAKIGVCDQIFTRIGASDDLASGQSTFMVEMNEVSYILKNATPASLLILDEIGRGTSTYDGLSIAWAVIEYIVNRKIIGARTLFATHYHELTDLEGTVPGIVNQHVSVKRNDASKEIQFLHKIEDGPADESYGIEVARLAGVDISVVDRAYEILYKLEQEGRGQAKRKAKSETKVMEGQMDLFSSSLALRQHDHIMDRLSTLDIQNMTPMDALRELYDLSMEAKKADKAGK